MAANAANTAKEYGAKFATGAAYGAKVALDKTPRVPPEYVKLTAEFLGTYMLVFAVGLNKTAGAYDTALQVFSPTSIAFTLMVMIYALASTSGGHFNPAVTYSAICHKAMDLKEGLFYIGAQVVGGCLAGLTVCFLYGFEATKDTDGPISPHNAKFLVGAPIVEFVYTFMLCFVFLNVAIADAKKGNNYYGLAIGFVVIAGGYGGGFVSGGAFNPAIAVGMNLMSLTTMALMLPIYVAVELLAAFFAVTALRIVRPDERQKTTAEDDLIPALGNIGRKLEAMFDPEDTAEFLGSMILVFTISLNGMLTQEEPNNDLRLGCIWSNGAALMCMYYAVGDISGGVFNPAATIAFLGRYLHTGGGVGKDKLCDPQVSPKEGLKYLLVQIIGGAAGAGLNLLVWLISGEFPAVEVGPKGSFKFSQAFFAEFYGTFLICYVFICVATTRNPLKEYAAFCIGGSVVAAGYSFGPLSGGLLNPAATIAQGVCDKFKIIWYPGGPLLYILAQTLGACVAAVIFRFVTHRDECEATAAIQGTAPLLG